MNNWKIIIEQEEAGYASFVPYLIWTGPGFPEHLKLVDTFYGEGIVLGAVKDVATANKTAVSWLRSFGTTAKNITKQERNFVIK